MGQTMSLLLLAGLVVDIQLQLVMLLRGKNGRDDEMRFRALQEAQEKGMVRLERELR